MSQTVQSELLVSLIFGVGFSNDSFEEFGDLVHHQVTLVLSVLRKKHVIIQIGFKFGMFSVIHQVAVDVNRHGHCLDSVCVCLCGRVVEF